MTRFWSKSFVGFKLRGGLNYAQFLGLPPIDRMKGAGHVPEPLTDAITIQLKEATDHKMHHRPPITFVWQRDGKDMRILKPEEAGVTMHPLGTGSGAAVVSEDGQLLRPEGMDCTFPAPDPMREAPKPPPLQPNTSGVIPEAVDISIPKQLVGSAGFDHLGFGEITVEVEYCALPVDVHHGSLFTVRQSCMTFAHLCRALGLNLRVEHQTIYKKWLTEVQGFDPGSVSSSKGKCLMRGMTLPPPQGAGWRSFKRKQLAAAQPRRAKRRKTAAMTGFQGGHTHDSLPDRESNTQQET